MKKLLVAICVAGFMAVFFIITATHSETINVRDEKLIRIAYMNGFVHAIQLNMDTIKKLREDEQILKKEVELAAESYLNVIKKINK